MRARSEAQPIRATRNYAAQRFGAESFPSAAAQARSTTPRRSSARAVQAATSSGREALPRAAEDGYSRAHRPTGLGKGVRVRHPKYGEGIIAAREGEGDDAKITVQFSGYGIKKLVEKFAQLERL